MTLHDNSGCTHALLVGCNCASCGAYVSPFDLPRGRPYDGAVVNKDGELVIPRQKPFVETWES